ncbi:Smg-4/UPF3 family-domain-containing protein [Suillus fuscotomentosus]|uniref:Smg-4/UPF3 family-domain-containing protein n=1 Tax=Suillus fuscotomentosus TaxID=1912939 RepID=A0AAD4HKU5_9AGAM|nr:Smg-4/UPF3 family-domain-containing protein [Suillus fuscotomentosus]KAG1900207.1 Smg-4/UPF3 family-domain-containing protein [Suillus fuscotomentosus]
MSVAEPKRNQAKQKQKDPKPQVPANATERLKTIIRRLPPNLPEEIFWQSVQTWVTDDSVSWKMYHAGKLSKRANQENVSSRAYIAFKNEEVLATFSREYDGHLFRDKAGNESQAVVEFAPFQKIPSEKKKTDARNATIDKDEDYISFLEALNNAEKSEHTSLEALIAASQPPAAPKTTPLLEALKAEKSAQKDKEAILRNHAHYKDISIASAARKEEVKKKAAVPATASQKQPEAKPAPPLSRKAKKAAAAAAAAQQTGPPAQTAQTTPAASKGASAGHANLPAKPPPQAPAVPRQRRSSQTRQQVPKVLAASLPPKPAVQPAPASAEAAPPASSRRGRPVVGLGRHFEAALNGAVGPSGGKKREKDAQPAPTREAVQKDVPDKPKDTFASSSPSLAVPSILQRGDGHAPGNPMIMQRPQPNQVPQSPPTADSHVGRGGAQRRGRGRGRGAPRGG